MENSKVKEIQDQLEKELNDKTGIIFIGRGRHWDKDIKPALQLFIKEMDQLTEVYRMEKIK